jgi:hypothetical protein
LAKDAVPPAPNGFVLAARYASTMLPQIFRTDDVLLEIDFAPEQRLPLEKLLGSLPQKTFLAEDSLGWVYQFWQSKKKDEVNKTGDKIDGRTLPAVTQLFTEHYMVQFLLHNTIGAWWCGRHGIQGRPGGAGVPQDKSPLEMEYLRWREDGTPAAGKFEGWPKTLAEFTMLDPCCGSGHFLVAAFNLLVALRMRDEKLTAEKACEAVLRDNLFGLELDPRCTQIAAFALALAAWKYPNAGGYRPLPPLHIACSGQGVTGKKDEWLAMANGDEKLCNGMERLYELFQQAPDLGSLIDPRCEAGDLFISGFAELKPMLQAALSTHKQQNADSQAIGVAAKGIAEATESLMRKYTLVSTNVPYLGFRDQAQVLRDYLSRFFSESLADLATSFVERCFALTSEGGSVALVTPQNWLFLKLYRGLREKLLSIRKWDAVARLGPRAFEMISGEIVNVALLVMTSRKPIDTDFLVGFDVSEKRTALSKAQSLLTCRCEITKQLPLLARPDCRLVIGEANTSSTIGEIAHSYKGLGTGDDPRFRRCFWEFPNEPNGWKRLQSSVDNTIDYGGCESVVNLAEMTTPLQPGVYMRGEETWGKSGVHKRDAGASAI